MKTIGFKQLSRWVLAGSLLVPLSTEAQENQPQAEDQSQAATAAVEQVELLRVDRDPSFDRYVNRPLLRRAVQALDPTLLTDVALQFVQGEAVLFRSHKSITAEEVLTLAIQVASDKRDKDALARLARACEQSGHEALSARVKIALELSGASRGVDPVNMVSVATMTPRAFATYQRVLNDLQSNKLHGDEEALRKLREALPTIRYLGDPEREIVEQQIDAALESIPESGNDVAKKLEMLSASSRAASKVEIDPRLYGSWQVGGHVFRIGKGDSVKARYAQKAVGQPTIEGALDATDKAHVYGLKQTGRSSTIFLNFQFQSDPKTVKVLRYDGTKYVSFGTWTKMERPQRTAPTDTAGEAS